MTDSTIPLFSNGLLSKWGFGDGDCLNDLLYDLEDAEGIKPAHHRVLVRVVREYVVPALDQTVLSPEAVLVRVEDIKRIAREEAGERLT